MSRRTWLRLGALGFGGIGMWGDRSGLPAGPPDGPMGDHRLIVRSRRPLNLESPTAALDERLTPNDEFFVRSHFGAPAVDLIPWEVEVVGLVSRPLRLTMEALGRFEPATKLAVLQCAGNGRGLYRPRVPGVPWERGAVGQAEWSGVRLAELLERAGIREGAAHLHFHGGDAPPSPKTPAFVRSIPIDQAREPSTILALRMNGEPLPTVHGGPIRLVVPGWAGNNWIKWVRRIVVTRDEAPGFYMQTAYRMARTPAPPGAPSGSVPADPVTWMNVKSLITAPGRGDVFPAGALEVRGVAWTGRGHVTKVEVRIGTDERWLEATISGDPEPGAWRQWRLSWKPPQPGRYAISARATDSTGEVQPEAPPWNKSGYFWNGYDTVEVKVR
jgi:DMSO/TMAO reductase YedYZ molybdopterin-dependent catalytic subunit